MIAATGGGLLFEPGSTKSLADKLQELMRAPQNRYELGRRGADAVHERFSDTAMADAPLGVYRKWLEESRGDANGPAATTKGEAT